MKNLTMILALSLVMLPTLAHASPKSSDSSATATVINSVENGNSNVNKNNIDIVNKNTVNTKVSSSVESKNINTNVANGGNATIAKDAVKNTNSNTQGQLQGQLQGQGQKQSISNSGNSSAKASNNGNNSNNSNNSSSNESASSGNTTSIVEEAQKRNPVNTAYAAPLTAAEDTCMGSSSVGGQGVGFGLSVGSTWQDADCVRRKDARELYNMKKQAAAIALMCQNDNVRTAMESVGDSSCEPKATKKAKAVNAEKSGSNISYVYPDGSSNRVR